MINRIEKKFVIENRISSNLFIKFLLPQFRSSFPTRMVNNIYFDSPDYQCFSDNIEGYDQRFKARIRWYNNDLQNSVLEVKIKEFNFGRKINFSLKDFNTEVDLLLFYRNLFNNSLIPFNFHPFLIDLIPTSYNSYDREYFESFDRKVRITCDKNLRFRKIFNNKVPRVSDLNVTDKTIVEIKYESSEEVFVSQMIKNTQLKVSKFSKYAFGVYHN